VGSVNENEISENDLYGITKFDKVGIATFTVKSVLIDPEEYPKDADCVAVIIALPDFRIVTVRPLIDIISAPKASVVKVYVENVLLFVEVGFVRLNGGIPYTRGITTKLDNTGVNSVAIYTYS
jgi:hypothetical protein